MPLELNYRIRIRSSRAKVRRAPDPFDAVLPASDLPGAPRPPRFDDDDASDSDSDSDAAGPESASPRSIAQYPTSPILPSPTFLSGSFA